MKRKPLIDWMVRKECCVSCPFKPDAIAGREQNPELAAEVQTRLLGASQNCHHPRLFGKREFELCRGARNWQLMIFYRLGFITEPTDAAWEAKRRAI
jgi:hypothetical protein